MYNVGKDVIEVKHITIGYYLLLTLFTVLMLLLEFVIPHGGIEVEEVNVDEIINEVYTEIEDGTSSDDVVTLKYSEELPEVLENATLIGSYFNDSVMINVYTFEMYNSNVYVADVITVNAVSIMSGLAYDSFGGSNIVQTVSDMAEDNNAIFAVNADYASHYDEGIVIRNGQILRDTISDREAVVLWYDGSISTFDESSTTAEELLEAGAWQVWSFGPALIDDGEIVASTDDGYDRDEVNNPRTAFGMVSENHYMFVVVDGRSRDSNGVDIEELADIMDELNCTEAYNFDGGGSSTMYFDGEVINTPSNEDEREVGDCVYITE